ncbi:MAG: hypothetical protein UU81_C0012G0003 [Microgenomates group bacterium GW2011_GWC1_41_8]|nr:MAG: hypothetical protein UU81_C0012G0003 [Microgenomates group bacterium GW2011_GWC1_41_8]
MAKKKQLTELEKDGFEIVPETVGRIIDSIWINEETQVLKIKFASGGTLVFQPIYPIKL